VDFAALDDADNLLLKPWLFQDLGIVNSSASFSTNSTIELELLSRSLTGISTVPYVQTPVSLLLSANAVEYVEDDSGNLTASNNATKLRSFCISITTSRNVERVAGGEVQLLDVSQFFFSIGSEELSIDSMQFSRTNGYLGFYRATCANGSSIGVGFATVFFLPTTVDLFFFPILEAAADTEKTVSESVSVIGAGGINFCLEARVGSFPVANTLVDITLSQVPRLAASRSNLSFSIETLSSSGDVVETTPLMMSTVTDGNGRLCLYSVLTSGITGMYRMRILYAWRLLSGYSQEKSPFFFAVQPVSSIQEVIPPKGLMNFTGMVLLPSIYNVATTSYLPVFDVESLQQPVVLILDPQGQPIRNVAVIPKARLVSDGKEVELFWDETVVSNATGHYNFRNLRFFAATGSYTMSYVVQGISFQSAVNVSLISRLDAIAIGSKTDIGKLFLIASVLIVALIPVAVVNSKVVKSLFWLLIFWGIAMLEEIGLLVISVDIYLDAARIGPSPVVVIAFGMLFAVQSCCILALLWLLLRIILQERFKKGHHLLLPSFIRYDSSKAISEWSKAHTHLLFRVIPPSKALEIDMKLSKFDTRERKLRDWARKNACGSCFFALFLRLARYMFGRKEIVGEKLISKVRRLC